MFVMDVAPQFGATVQIDGPGGEQQHIRVTFNYVVGDEYKALSIETAGQPAAQFMGRLVAGWETTDGPAGEWSGMPVPYSAEALAELLKKRPRAARGLMAAYNHEVLGLPLGN